jgi:uncharacterized protein (TIGR02246 family)
VARKSNLMLLFITIFAVACQPVEESTETVLLDVDEEAIKYLVEKYDNAITSGNADEFMSIYSRTAVVMPPGRPVLFGAEAVRERIAEFLAANDVELQTDIQEIVVDRDHVMIWYNYAESWTLKTGGATTSVEGKGVQIFQQQPNGSWRISREIWNTDNPGGGS